MSTAAALYLFNRDLSRYGTIVLLVIGTISCSCSLMVFTQETLRQSPCTIYLIAINVLNLVYIFWALIIRTLQFGYNIDPSSTSLVFCRLLYYISVVFSSCESSYLLLASIDRILITSSSATTRQRSTRRAAYLSMALISLFWAIFHTHLFIFIDILHFGPYYTVCFYRPGIYNTIMTYYSIGINGVLTLSLMTVFGLWAVRNVRRLRRPNQTTPQALATIPNVTVHRPNVPQSKDHQLIRMLLVDILAYIMCKCPVQVMLVYNEITKQQEKSAEQSSIEQSILLLTYFIFFVDNCIGCYTNLLVSKTFRTEVKGVLRRIRLRFRCVSSIIELRSLTSVL